MTTFFIRLLENFTDALIPIWFKKKEVKKAYLQQKKIEVMEYLYESLIDIKKQAQKTLFFIEAPRHPQDIREQAEKLYEDIMRLGYYFDKKKIVLEEKACMLIKEVVSQACQPATHYLLMVINNDDHELKSLNVDRDQAWSKTEKNLIHSIVKMEDEFRKILGSHHPRLFTSRLA